MRPLIVRLLEASCLITWLLFTACDDSATSPRMEPVCTGTAHITPDSVPVIAPGNSTELTFSATCTETPVVSWRSSDTSVMRISLTNGVKAVILARAPGSATIFAHLIADTAVRAAVELKSAASYDLVAVAGQLLPATVRLQTPDVICESNHTSEAVFKSGRLAVSSDHSFQADFAWTRVCISSTGERKPFDQSATGRGTYVVNGDSLAFTYTKITSPDFGFGPCPCDAGAGRLNGIELSLALRAPGFIIPQPMILRQ